VDSGQFAQVLILYGAFYGMTEGTEKAVMADLLLPENRGRGFGAMQMVLGLAALPASLLMGWLMTTYGSPSAFLVSSGLAAAGACALIVWRYSGQGADERG
jgi:MFS family permease